jgi:hypothetical protein
MHLPTGAEFAWFLSGMWATIFILRAGRSSHAGFFAVFALLIVAIAPAAGLLYQDQLGQIAQAVQGAVRAQ